VDDEVREVVEGLARAHVDSGLTQADFATALGTSASRMSAYLAGRTMPSAGLYLRAIRLARCLKGARQHGWMTPQSAVREIRGALRQGDESWALKMALQARDQLCELLRLGSSLVPAWGAAPPSTGDRRWDALLAALTAHAFADAGERPPLWAVHPSKSLSAEEEWTLPSLLLSEEAVRAHTPGWLAAYGVHATERDLVTA
jgi:transcriptional regulator with XRE-family HTH domain